MAAVENLNLIWVFFIIDNETTLFRVISINRHAEEIPIYFCSFRQQEPSTFCDTKID